MASHGPSACLLGFGMEGEGRTNAHIGPCVIRTTAAAAGAADHISHFAQITVIPLSLKVSDAHSPQHTPFTAHRASHIDFECL